MMNGTMRQAARRSVLVSMSSGMGAPPMEAG
jgi:hypothetical protein